ncbi:hypothetical protein BDW22DRAFT_1352839 [Trametopsis cervina]|nr:hypothetical protein BDW22DRAFT_1352839 [Trametopsis cervina]
MSTSTKNISVYGKLKISRRMTLGAIRAPLRGNTIDILWLLGAWLLPFYPGIVGLSVAAAAMLPRRNLPGLAGMRSWACACSVRLPAVC